MYLLVMLSANVHEEQGADLINPCIRPHLLKPIKVAHLLGVLQKSFISPGNMPPP